MTSAESASDQSTYEADLLVIGAGIGGLATAGRAAQRGSKVVVIEKEKAIGGSALLSGGFFWTLNSYDILRAEIPKGDPEMGRVLIDRYEDAVEWVRSLGITMSDRVAPRPIPMGSGFLIDIKGLLDRCCQLVIQAGGLIMTETTVEALETSDGRVIGAKVHDRDGVTVVKAPWTVMATGGFQGDQSLRERFIGNSSGSILVRSNPGSTGDGLRLGLEVGAAHVDGMNGFYGHLMAYPLVHPFVPGDYLRLMHSVHSLHDVLIDTTGHRFVDESIGYYMNAQALTTLQTPRAIAVGDEWVRANFAAQAPTDGMEIIDVIAEAETEGAHVARAETLHELSEKVAEWGYDPSAVEAMLTEFNEAVVANPEKMEPARIRNQRPLTEPPFYAVEVQPAITFTHGGLKIDPHSRVLGEDGKPIPGFFAVGVDGAGVHNIGYAGGLSVGVVFGLQAVDTIYAAAS